MVIEKMKARLAYLSTEAEQKIEEAKKAGDEGIRLYYEGSLYCVKMILSSMDSKIVERKGKRIVVDDFIRKDS